MLVATWLAPKFLSIQILPVVEVTSTTVITEPPHGKVGQATVVITTSSVEGVQGVLEIVHRKVAVPGTAKPVTPDVGEPGLVIVAVPETTVHNPVPVTGVLPAKVAVVTPQAGVISEPALAKVGSAVLLVINTSSVEAVQGALEIVHLKVLAPTPRAVSPEVGEEGVVIVPAPEINVHNPVPDAGVFPAKVAVVAQTF
jgi:hypothetical protein